MEVRDVRVPEVNRQKLQELLEGPELRGRMQAMLVLGLSFLVGAFVIGGIAVSGMVPPQRDLSGGGLWWSMVAVSAADLVAAWFIVRLLLGQLPRSGGLNAAAAKGMNALIIGLACGQSVSIYALVGAMMAMPTAVQVGLVVASVIAQITILSVVRGRVGYDLARRLYLEAEARRRR